MPGERGAALICALMVTALLTTLGAALAFLMATETVISANYRSASEALYAADAGVERAMADLRATDWTGVLAPPPANVMSGFDDAAMSPVDPSGAPLDLTRLTAALQGQSDARYGVGPDSPGWRLFAHADLTRLMPAASISTPAYVVVWVADDAEDGDGNPSRDSNGVLMLRAESFGIAGAHRIVEATVARPGGVASAIRLASWREIR